jgi:hypothetical protein
MVVIVLAVAGMINRPLHDRERLNIMQVVLSNRGDCGAGIAEALRLGEH